MKKDYSFGIIPLREGAKDFQVLLVQHHSGHWAFPKGHPEGGEIPRETAERELREETGLAIQSFLPRDPLTEFYEFTSRGEFISKTVQYFIAWVSHQEVVIQKEEIKDYRWCTFSEALELMTFKEGKELFEKVAKMLKGESDC